MENKIGFIGAGNMATAIIGGMINGGLVEPEQIAVCDLDPSKCEQLKQKGCLVYADASTIACNCPVVFLAVKPQNYAGVLRALKGIVTEKTLFVSIAAGISTAYVMEQVGCSCGVVRVMPNTPLLLGAGATALCRSSNVTDEQFEHIVGIFRASGIIEILEEEQMNAVISVNGSSPAYIYLFAKAVVEEAARQGINPQAALRLFAGTLVGSAKMLTDSGSTPNELIRMVSSPGGTTLKALETLVDGGFEDLIAHAMRSCTKRAEELGK